MEPKSPPKESEESPASLTSDTGVDFEVLLQQECRRWQKRLYLRDWTVRVVLKRAYEMTNSDTLATIIQYPESKDAVMEVLSPLDLPPPGHPQFDEEEQNYGLSIVHELIHLHFSAFDMPKTEWNELQEEQAVNALSRALVALAHRPKASLPPRAAEKTETREAGHYL